MKKRVLLTGATGFVGRQVLRSLCASGVTVDVVVRDGSDIRSMEEYGVGRILSTVDMFAEDVAWWQSACTDVDIVVHAAWYAEPGRYLQSSVNLDCLEGTLRLARGASRVGVKRFVGIGTCFEYDLTPGHLSVNTPLRPTTPYAAAKASTFWMLSQWLPTQGLEFLWCRLFYLYGEGEDPRRLVAMVRKKLAAGEPVELTSGAQLRDFMDVRSAGHRIAGAALSALQGPLNVCSGTGISVRAMAEEIADEFGRRDLLRFGARPDNLVDPPCVVGVLPTDDQ